MVVVELTWVEQVLAGQVGVMRRVSAVNKGRQEYFETEGGGWTGEVNGATAEMAVAKHFNLFWSGTVGRVDLPDVGSLQVRSKTRAEHCLIVKPEDCDEDIFIGVLVEPPRFTLTGWLYGYEAKQPRWWREGPNLPRPAFFVPDSALRRIEDLPYQSIR